MNKSDLERCIAQYWQVLAQEHSIQRFGVIVVDLTGLVCPEPLMMLRQHVRQIQYEGMMLVLATDPAAQRDIPAYCRFTGQTLVHQALWQEEAQDVLFFLVQKGVIKSG